LGTELPFEMVELLEWIVVTYGASSYFFALILNDEVSVIGIICVIYGLLNAFLPMEKFNKFLFQE